VGIEAAVAECGRGGTAPAHPAGAARAPVARDRAGDAAGPRRCSGADRELAAHRTCNGERSEPGPRGPPGSDPPVPLAGTDAVRWRWRWRWHRPAAGAPAPGHRGPTGPSG
jgi:hypothetical protein